VIGEIRVVEDVPEAFAQLVATEVRSVLSTRASSAAPYRLGCSGGSSGERCFSRLAAVEDLAWDRIECYFADERCVPADAPQSNQRALRQVLGDRLDELAGFYPMVCGDGPDEGADAYEAIVRRAGGFDLIQLGFGPDGHTASLFPGSAGLEAPEGALVVMNSDPSGRNPLERMTLTYEAIATASVVAIAVTGEGKRDALKTVVDGGDLPAGRVRAERVIWLCDHAAADGIVG